MSRQDSAGPATASESIVEQKQRNNIYTMLLILSFVGICTACVFLWLELQEYGVFPWWKTSNIPQPATASLPALWQTIQAIASSWA